MNVSPANGGTITSPSFSTPALTYPKIYTCDTSYTLTAVPNSSANYKFSRWGGGVSGTTNPITVNSVPNDVTAYFVLKSDPVVLQGAKSLVDSAKDVLVLDVSSASDYAASHMLCAKNYVWNSGSNSFSTSITNLTPFKEDDILIYDQTGTLSEAAADYLAGQGFEAVSYMSDSLLDWEDAGYETFITGNYPGGDSDICTSLEPIAHAGDDQSVNENQKVTLNGSPDSGVTYTWLQAEGRSVTLSNSSTQNPTFTAPDLDGVDDTLIFHLTVTNGSGNTYTDTVAITVQAVVVDPNDPPEANAGADQTVTEGGAVTLDGTDSSDSDGTIASYTWTQTDSTGVTVVLSSNSEAKPTFTAPDVDASTILILTLVVTDNEGAASSTDTVRITITKSSGGGGGGCFIDSLAD